MIAVDTSAILAVLFQEPEAEPLIESIVDADFGLMSAATLLECMIVAIARVGPKGRDDVDDLVSGLGIYVAPVDADQAVIATDAFLRFGKDRHEAALNYGDCFSYGLSKARDCPLLFKGGDFAKTDVTPALTG